MQQALSLPNVTEVFCTHVNIRTETHGEDHVRAVDLAFEMEGGNELLNLFHPELRAAIFCNKATDAGQVALPNVLAVLPNLRVPGMPERLRFGGDDKHGGYRMAVDYGLGPDQSNVDLAECVVGKKWYEPKEGGTCKIGWRVSYSGESLNDALTRGKLTGLKDQKAFLQLHAPAVLQVIKGGKAKVSRPSDDGDLLGGDDESGEGGDVEEDTPEAALARAEAAAG